MSQSDSLLLEQWKSYTLTSSSQLQVLRPVTLQAWKRCQDLGLNPQQLEYVFLSDEEFEQKRSHNAALLQAALPYMEHLSLCLAGKPYAIALADAEGWILELLEQPTGALGGRDTGACIGSSWNEKQIGNNGVGTALATGEPVLVYGIEHYAMAYHSAYCLGVPIEVGGKIIGCLDVSVIGEENANPAYLTLAQACVASIETTLNSQSQFSEKLNSLERLAAFGSLSATAIHDLKNPLNVIRGFSQLGVKIAKQDQERQYFQKIQNSVDTLVGMLKKLQANSQAEVLVSSSLSTVLQEILDQIAPLCQEAGIELKIFVEKQVKVDLKPKLFKRAIENLLSNAIEAMPEGGSLSVHATVKGTRIAIAISDTGDGIPAEIQPKIFQPFVSNRTDGTGLGLYSVHQTVTQDHQGKIWFETHPGKGTTFFVELPLDNSPAHSSGVSCCNE